MNERNWTLILTHFWPMFPFYTPWKPLVFCCFQGVKNGNIGRKWVENSVSYAIFRKKLFPFLRPAGNSKYGIYDPFGVGLINRLCLGFSHLREYKFRHNFADTVNPLCSCTLETENTEHFFLRCQKNLSARTTLMNELNNISNAINYLTQLTSPE